MAQPDRPTLRVRSTVRGLPAADGLPAAGWCPGGRRGSVDTLVILTTVFILPFYGKKEHLTKRYMNNYIFLVYFNEQLFKIKRSSSLISTSNLIVVGNSFLYKRELQHANRF